MQIIKIILTIKLSVQLRTSNQRSKHFTREDYDPVNAKALQQLREAPSIHQAAKRLATDFSSIFSAIFPALQAAGRKSETRD